MVKPQPTPIKYNELPSVIRSLLKRVGVIKIPDVYQYMGSYIVISNFKDANILTKKDLKLLIQSQNFVSVEPAALSATKPVLKFIFKETQ